LDYYFDIVHVAELLNYKPLNEQRDRRIENLNVLYFAVAYR